MSEFCNMSYLYHFLIFENCVSYFCLICVQQQITCIHGYFIKSKIIYKIITQYGIMFVRSDVLAGGHIFGE